jgi:hypothetical protein
VTFNGSMSAIGWGGSESLPALGSSVLALREERSSPLSVLSSVRDAAGCEGWAPAAVFARPPSSAGTPSSVGARSLVLEADPWGLAGRIPTALFVGSSFVLECLICSGDRAMAGTRYRDPTPRAHTPKTIIRLIVTACTRSF